MRVVCSTCAAKYELRDERVLGRVVKIRCKRCGQVVVVDGSAEGGTSRTRVDGSAEGGTSRTRVDGSAEGGTSRTQVDGSAEDPAERGTSTAARNESSVLFSLAMLARREPDPPPAPPPTEDIVNLSAGGPFAAAFAPPILAAEPPAPRPVWPIALAVAAGLVLVFAIPAAVFAARARPSATLAPPTATPTASATATATASATASATATPTLARALPASATPTLTPARSNLVAAPTIIHTATAPACCAGESPAACEMRRSVGAACTESAPPFDAAAARRALASIDLGSCKRPGGPSGSGHVRVTFDTSGAVTTAIADAPFSGTPAGRCVESRYRGARVPAFAGSPLTVGKSFSLD